MSRNITLLKNVALMHTSTLARLDFHLLHYSIMAGLLALLKLILLTTVLLEKAQLVKVVARTSGDSRQHSSLKRFDGSRQPMTAEIA
jgi:hypothetical protein